MLRYTAMSILEILRAFDHAPDNYIVVVVGEDALLLAIARVLTRDERFLGLRLGQQGIIGIDMLTGAFDIPTTRLP